MNDDSGILRAGAVALVTGASSGIGLDIARGLAAHGAGVICSGRDRERLRRTIEEIGPNACPLVLDVTDAGAVDSLLQDLPPQFEPIDILVNNAGHDVGGRKLFYDGTSADWDAIIDTNVKGLLRVTRAVLPGMLARGRGHIVNIGSVAGVYTFKSGSVYNASKFAVHGFSDALRKDLDDTNVRVTEVMPGLVRTSFAENRHQGDKETANKFYDSFPACLHPEDVARAVIYVLQQPPGVVVSQLMIEPARVMPVTTGA